MARLGGGRSLTARRTDGTATSHLRVVAWRTGAGTGLITRSPDSPPPTPDDIRSVCERARASGYDELLTTALGPAECAPFRTCGFTTHVALVLLVRDLAHRTETRTAAASPITIRTAGDRDWAAIEHIDRAAFDDFWHLDRVGLGHALGATAISLLRIADDADGAPVAYTVTGINHAHGFVQRVAVHPDRQRRGIAGACLDDAISWAIASDARHLMVNTEHHNDAALRLYASRRFERQRDGLVVMRLAL
jgi:ribosomal protein S18 acetylase RimI-like enzyme